MGKTMNVRMNRSMTLITRGSKKINSHLKIILINIVLLPLTFFHLAHCEPLYIKLTLGKYCLVFTIGFNSWY